MKRPASTPNAGGAARRVATPRADPKHAPRARRTPFVLLILGLIVGGMCALLVLNTASAANEVSRGQLAGDDESVAAQVAQLENDVAASAAPANLANAAGELGMVPAGNPAFLVIGADGRVRLLGSPAPASGYPVYVAPAKKSPAKKARAKKAKAKKTSKKRGTAATKSGTPTATPSKTAKPSTTGTPSSAKTTSGSRSPSPHRQSSTPRPTPTPNTTLPGGTR